MGRGLDEEGRKMGCHGSPASRGKGMTSKKESSFEESQKVGGGQIKNKRSSYQ